MGGSESKATYVMGENICKLYNLINGYSAEYVKNDQN